MTDTVATLLVILVAGLAGLALVGSLRLGRRYRLRRAWARATRQAPTEPAHRPAATTRHLLLPALRHLVQHRRRPPVHAGATLGWSPAAAVADVGTAPELTTPTMAMVADHHALDTIAQAQADFGTALEAALDWFLRDDPGIRLRVASALEQTQEINLVELRTELALAGAR